MNPSNSERFHLGEPEIGATAGRYCLPGILAALLCGFVYFGFGTQWTCRPRPSLYVHHTLTAQAWLSGRTYVGAHAIERQYMVNSLQRAGRPYNAHWSNEQLRREFIALQGDYFRSIGVPERDIAAEIDGSLRRAFLDWVRIDTVHVRSAAAKNLSRSLVRYYAYWPPVPAAIMVPLVAMLGTDFSDAVIANVLGALTVFIVYWMLVGLRRHWPALTQRACLALTFFYGLGTCHMYQASTGQVWLITQLTATLFLVLAIGLAFRAPPPLTCARGSDGCVRLRYFLFAAITLALGFLSRSTMILATPFFLVLLWIASRPMPRPLRTFLTVSAPCLLILVTAIGIQLAFNHVRFGHALDFGQGRLADEGGNDLFAAEFREHGRFSLHYLPRNIWYYFLNPTIREYPAHEAAQVGWTFDPMGNSLFLISPAFVYVFLCARSSVGRGLPAGGSIISSSGGHGPPFPAWKMPPRGLLWAVLAGAIPGLTALMLFHGTGWYQFGQRYLLDVLPFFLLLAAFGMRGRLTRVSLALIGVSFVMNAWGAHRFILEQG
jgi:4-amino-4-deoxy-L-arabinose transferase-like glycosyltransferase